MTYMTYVTYITDSTYRTYITDTLHFLRFQSMTRHDFTSHPDVWQLRAWEGEGDRGKKSRVVHVHGVRGH